MIGSRNVTDRRPTRASVTAAAGLARAMPDSSSVVCSAATQVVSTATAATASTARVASGARSASAATNVVMAARSAATVRDRIG